MVTPSPARPSTIGRACDADPAVPAPPASGGPYVAVVERGVCPFTEKVANVEAVTANGGYAATIVMNREGPDGCGSFGMSVEGAKPAVSVDRRTGYSFFDIEGQYSEEACRAGDGSVLAPITLGAVGDEVTVRAFFNGWGYVHLYRNGTGKLTELDTYAIPEAMDPRFASGFGNLTVHEVASSQRPSGLVYSSYYAGGFRVFKIDSGKIREVGAFIDQGGNDFWGVEVFRRGGRSTSRPVTATTASTSSATPAATDRRHAARLTKAAVGGGGYHYPPPTTACGVHRPRASSRLLARGSADPRQPEVASRRLTGIRTGIGRRVNGRARDVRPGRRSRWCSPRFVLSRCSPLRG